MHRVAALLIFGKRVVHCRPVDKNLAMVCGRVETQAVQARKRLQILHIRLLKVENAKSGQPLEWACNCRPPLFNEVVRNAFRACCSIFASVHFRSPHSIGTRSCQDKSLLRFIPFRIRRRHDVIRKIELSHKLLDTSY